jgi:hypothetical protein
VQACNRVTFGLARQRSARISGGGSSFTLGGGAPQVASDQLLPSSCLLRRRLIPSTGSSSTDGRYKRPADVLEVCRAELHKHGKPSERRSGGHTAAGGVAGGGGPRLDSTGSRFDGVGA